MITVWDSESAMDTHALTYAKDVEKVAKAKHLYFCRYAQVSVEKGPLAWTELKMQTAEPEAKFRNVWAVSEAVKSAVVADCDPCSIPHSHAFQVAKHLGLCAKDPWPLADVLHWLCNMAGMTYMQEVQLYCISIQHFAQQKDEQEAAFKKFLLSLNQKPTTK